MFLIVVFDVFIEIDQGQGVGVWWFENFFFGKFQGLVMFCNVLRQLFNMVIVCFVQDIGMFLIGEYVCCFGVYDELLNYLFYVFGVGEIMVMWMVMVYLMLVNGGCCVKLMLIDCIQDCYGCIIFKYDQCECCGCDVFGGWKNQFEL